MRKRIAISVIGTWFLAILSTTHGAESVEQRLRTDPLMIPYYTGKVLPTPQQAAYKDEYLSMGNVLLVVGKDVENPAALTALLIDRIARYGGKAAIGEISGTEHTAIISLGDTLFSKQAAGLPAIPERPEAYILQCNQTDGKPLVILKGRDRLGLLWAVSSLIQLIHWKDGKTLARAAELVDYPRGQKRGYIHADSGSLFYSPSYLTWGKVKDTNTPDSVYLLQKERQFTLLSKFNTMVYAALVPVGHGDSAHPEEGYWKTPDKWKPELNFDGVLEKMSNSLTAYGLSWYGSVHPLWHKPADKFCGDEGTVVALLTMARKMEAAGGHLNLQLDDGRFPLPPWDREHFGSAREADTWVVTNLMARLMQESPQAKLLVCTPFYWGPVGSGWKSYGEDRDAYLAMIGHAWPPEVDVWWTGQQVNGMPLGQKNYVEWYSGLIKRKPFLWQNNAVTWGRAYNYHYGAEPILSLKHLYWDGFLESLGFYGFNSVFPVRCIANAISGDFQWNPDAYNAEESVKEAASKFVGPSSWKTLEAFSEKLSYFDRFASQKNYRWFYNGPFRNNERELWRYAARNVDILETKFAEVEALYQALLADNKVAIEAWTGSAGFLQTASNVVLRAKTDKGLAPYRKAVGQRAIAQKAGDFDPDTNDYFLAASSFKNGMLTDVTDGLLESLLGDGEPHPALVLAENSLSTEAVQWLWNSDLVDRFELRISARQGPDASEVFVKLNGQEIYRAPAAFGKEAPSTLRMAIPPVLMKEKDNILAIGVSVKEKEGFDAKGDDVPPLAIQYAVFKRIAKGADKAVPAVRTDTIVFED